MICLLFKKKKERKYIILYKCLCVSVSTTVGLWESEHSLQKLVLPMVRALSSKLGSWALAPSVLSSWAVSRQITFSFV